MKDTHIYTFGLGLIIGITIFTGGYMLRHFASDRFDIASFDAGRRSVGMEVEDAWRASTPFMIGNMRCVPREDKAVNIHKVKEKKNGKKVEPVLTKPPDK